MTYKDWDEQGDFFPLRPITLWRCNSCGYVDVVRLESDDICGGCQKMTSGMTHGYRPEPLSVRSDRNRMKLVPPDGAA